MEAACRNMFSASKMCTGFLVAVTVVVTGFFAPAAQVHAAELIGHWALDESTQGSTVADTGTGSNNGTPSGTGGGPSPSTTVAPVNFTNPRSYLFNGSNQYVQIASNFTSAVSVTFWFRPLANGSGNGSGQWYSGIGLFDAEIGGVTNDFGVTWSSDRVLFGIGNPDVTIRSSAVSLDAWHHVAATWQKSDGAMKLYIDGTLVDSSTNGSLNNRISTNVRFGVLLSGVNGYFNGYMDDIRTYDVALDASQIQNMANGDSVSDLIATAFSPLDNATSVATSTNLSFTLGTTTVATSTGPIRIYKTSDDSLVESISLSSGAMTRSQTVASTTFTIDPSVSLVENTGYYVSIASTTFQYGTGGFWPGTTASSTWNFTTGDFTSSSISSVTASSSASTTASVTWTTDEAASSKVTYGLTTSYGTSTAEADTSPRVTSHSVALSSLLPCTTYHYVVVSKDAAANTSTSTDSTFTTIGCEYTATPNSVTSNTITSSSGGSTSIDDDGKTFTVTAPANATATSSSFVIQVKAIPSESVLSSLGRPVAAPDEVGVTVFDVKAIINGSTILDSFDAEITIGYEYSEDEISNINESALWLYHYTGGRWVALNDCSVNRSANTISCTTPSFSVFGLFGSENQQSSSGGGGGIRFGCKDPKAINYDYFSRHKQELCKYENSAKSVTVAIPATSSGIPGICEPYIRSYITYGGKNDPESVKKLEQFLNEKQGEKVAVDGVYSVEDVEAVKRFQQKYASEVLTVWGLTKPTGNVYRTTLMKINSFYCGAQISCPLFTEHNSLTENFVSPEIGKTKKLLTELGFYAGDINNTFDSSLDVSLKNFQETFKNTMLTPWGLSRGTGYKYKTTNKFLNLIVGCETGVVDLDGRGFVE